MCPPVEIVFKPNFNIISARQYCIVISEDGMHTLKSMIFTLEFYTDI
jgi:hypothetical protein